MQDYRDDLGAAHAKAEILERELEEMRAENEELRAQLQGTSEPAALAPIHEPPGAQVEQTRRNAWVIAAAGALIAALLGLTLLRFGPLGLGLTILLACLAIYYSLTRVVTPSDALAWVIFGASLRDGEPFPYRVLLDPHKSHLPLPLLERAFPLSLSPMSGHARATTHLRGVTATLEAHFTFRISATFPTIDRAINRFLYASEEELQRVAQELVTDALRGAAERWGTEQGAPSGLDASAHEALASAIREGFKKLGLALGELTVQREAGQP